MAINTNHGIIVGNLCADPEYVERGENPRTGEPYKFCDLRVAVNHSSDKASFFDVKTFGPTAEACSKYLAKGKKVAVSYELRQETWETDEGQKRSKVVLAARQVEFLTPANGNGEAPVAAAAATEAPSTPAAGEDDIPF